MIQFERHDHADDSEPEATAALHLERAGIRVSAERIRALGLLIKFKGRSWTVQELVRPAPGESAEPAAITRLYRSLHLLEKAGVVEREIVETRGRPNFAYRLAEPRSSIRFQCRTCNLVVVTESAPLRAQVEKIGNEKGMSVSPADLMVWVTCSRCETLAA